jgi:dynein intermediate chain
MSDRVKKELEEKRAKLAELRRARDERKAQMENRPSEVCQINITFTLGKGRERILMSSNQCHLEGEM